MDKCSIQYYCNTNCQKAHWTTHKISCFAPQKHKSTVDIHKLEDDDEKFYFYKWRIRDTGEKYQVRNMVI